MYHISGEGKAKGTTDMYFKPSYNPLWDSNESFQFFISNYSRTHLKDVHLDFYSLHKRLLKILLLLTPQVILYATSNLHYLFCLKQKRPL